MRKFLKILFCFSIILLIFAVVGDSVISFGLRQTGIRKYAVWNDIYARKIDANVVVLGSSRAWCGYNTYILDSLLGVDSYNIGIDGHPIDFQIHRYNTYCRFSEKPSVLLLNVDFLSTLSNSAQKGYEREQFFPYIWDDSLISVIANAKNISLLDRYVPLYRYIGYRDECENGFLAFCGKTTFADAGMYKGFRGNEYSWSVGSLAKDTIVRCKVCPQDEDLLELFVSDVKRNGVEVIMVKSPIYLPLFSHFENVEYSDSVFSALADRLSIPILDYYHDTIFADSTLFYNPSHLNKYGSEVFTTILCNDLKELCICPE